MSVLLRLGQPVAIHCWWGDHFALFVGEDREGRPVVAHNSAARGGVAIELLDNVRGSREIEPLPPSTRLCGEEVVRRALSREGTRYSFFSWNCEDYVWWALGEPPRSPQREALGTAVGAIGFAALLAVTAATVARD